MIWETKTIKELCFLVTDGSHSSPREVEIGFPMASSKDMLENDFDYSNIKQVSEDDYLKLVKGNCKPLKDDILLIKDGNSYLKRIFAVKEDKDMVLLSSIAILRTNTELINPIFFQYSLRNPVKKKEMENYVSGAAIPRIVLNDFKGMNIKTPPLKTQKRIADILSAHDDLIENNLKRIKLLEQAAQNIYKEWFVHLRFPEHENAVIKKETGLPAGWEKSPFSDVADFINGYAFKPRHHSKKGLPIIKIKELKNGVKEDTPRNSGEDVPNKYHFGDNTILFSWSASLDVYWWYGGASLLNQHLFKVLPNSELNKWHFFYGLKGAVEEFRSRANGATMQHIKKGELKNVYYTKPTMDIALNFQDKIEPILKQVLVLNKQKDKLKAARDILLPRLMNRTIGV